MTRLNDTGRDLLEKLLTTAIEADRANPDSEWPCHEVARMAVEAFEECGGDDFEAIEATLRCKLESHDPETRGHRERDELGLADFDREQDHTQ